MEIHTAKHNQMNNLNWNEKKRSTNVWFHSYVWLWSAILENFTKYKTEKKETEITIPICWISALVKCGAKWELDKLFEVNCVLNCVTYYVLTTWKPMIKILCHWIETEIFWKSNEDLR